MANLRIIPLFIALIFIWLTFSCANLKESTIQNQISIKSASEIEGNYSNVSLNDPAYRYNDLKKLIDHRNKIKNTDSIISVAIKVLNDKEIQFMFTDLNNNQHEYITKYQIERGKIILNNKNFTLEGIPYIFGGYSINKSEISITRERNLILNSVAVNEGAILLILPASIPNSYYENIYVRE